MIKIRCVVERVTYQNPENGYSVLRCAVKNERDLVTVVGSLLDVNVGSVLLIEGNWKMDGKYGRQFAAERWEETVPATVFGMAKYLGSGLIKGVGPRFAGRIVRHFGTETLEIIESDIHRLLEYKPPQGYQKNEESPLEGDVLIVIDSHCFSVVRLTRIFRQAQASRIVMNAHRINAGQMPDTTNGKQTDFFFMPEEDPEAALGKIVALVHRKLPGYYGVTPDKIQVLTPMQRGVWEPSS